MAPNLSVPRVLVIGATGLVGSVLVRKLRERDAAVRAFARPSSNRSMIETAGAEFVLGDVGDPASLDAAMDGIDVVFNLAVPRHKVGQAGNVLHRAGDRSVVVDGAMNVAHAAHRADVGRLVHVSSAGVAGRARRGAISEDDTPKPDRDYRINRLEAENRLRAYADDVGLSVQIARLTHIYGPGDPSMEKTFRLIARGNYTLWGDGMQLHHISYVDDIAEGLIAMAKATISRTELYILGSRPMQLWSWLQLIAEATGGQVKRHAWMGPVLRPASRLYDVLDRPFGHRFGIGAKLDFHVNPVVYDISKSRRDLDVPEDVPPAIAVARTADWYRKAGKL